MRAANGAPAVGGQHRRVGRRTRWAAALLTAGAILGPAAASAVPPGGVNENPRGASAVVAPAEVVVGGVARFSGIGFAPGEEVTAKVDNGAILRKGSTSDVLGTFIAAGDGTLSGAIDLAAVNDATPVVPGAHLIRFLSSAPEARSLHADFTVVSSVPAPGTPTAPPPSGAPVPGAPTPAPGATPPPGSTPTPAARGVVWLRAATLRVRGSRATLKLQAGAAGSAGEVRVRSASKVRLGKAKAKIRTLFKTESYYVGKAGTSTVRLALTAEGKKLLRPGRSLSATVRLEDVTGETVTERVTVRR